MRKTKKFLFSIFALGMASFSLASCGDSEKTDTKTITESVGPTETVTTTKTETPTTSNPILDIIGEFNWEEYAGATFTYKIGEDGEEIEVSATITKEETTIPSCTKDGLNTYIAKVVINGEEFIEKKEEVVPKLNHNYENPEYVWAYDYSTCKASVYCEYCQNEITEEVTSTKDVLNEVSCNRDGLTKYTVDFTNEVFEDQEVEVTTPKTENHDYTCKYTWSIDNKECMAEAVCSVCNGTITEKKETEESIITTATCLQDGIIIYTANFDNNIFETQSKEVNIGRASHKLDKYYGYPASFFNEGRIEHNKCTICGKLFDLSGNEITDASIPLLSKEISLAINSDKYALTLVEANENSIQWKLEVSEVKVGDTIKLFLKDGSEYSFFNMDGIDDDYKVTVDATDVTFNVVATPNGVAISLEYETEEKGIFVEVTNESGVTLYPMSEINYNFGTETNSYVYGYISLLVGDKVLIKDTINDKTYGYDDILETEIWRSHYFTCGDNGEIIINTTDRVGFEFSRNGDEKLTLAFVHDPVTVTSMEVAVKGEVDTAPLTKNTISEDSNEYGYALHVLNHESTVNARDIKEYILANGYIVYQIELPISAPMSICLKDNSGNTYGYSAFESKYSSSDFTYSNDEGYIHLETSGTYVIMFIPSCGNIAISFAPASEALDAYYMTSKESSFTGLTKDSNNIVTVSNIDFDKNGYIAFTDSSYNMLTVTLDTTTDFIVSSTLLMCTKAGKYTLTLNLDTLVVHVDVVEYATLTGLVDGAAINLGSYSSKTFKRNASNEAEVVAEGMVITAANQYVSIMDPNGEGVTDITVASDSSSLISLLAAGSYFLVFAETGTYNIYVNEDTHVVRVVKTA